MPSQVLIFMLHSTVNIFHNIVCPNPFDVEENWPGPGKDLQCSSDIFEEDLETAPTCSPPPPTYLTELSFPERHIRDSPPAIGHR